MTDSSSGRIRPRGVVVRPGSRFSQAFARLHEMPKWDLKDHHGKKISDLVFINCFVGGGTDAWDKRDIDNIDEALAAAMSDRTLQSVMAQYYSGSITSKALPRVVDDSLSTVEGSRVFKDEAEDLAGLLLRRGVLGDHDPGQCVINILLPRGVILVDGFSPGFEPPSDAREEHSRRARALIKIDDDEGDSTEGLGGYHGSVHVAMDGQTVTTYYAVGVFSEGGNGIVQFDKPWENVVATFYHELNEARTDPDVEDAVRFDDDSRIGWYSEIGQGEIGDLPINEAERGLVPMEDVFKTVTLESGSEVPIQLMWSNADHAPSAGE